jgi:plastocyanin
MFKNADDPGVYHDVDIRAANKKTVVVDQTPTDAGQTSENRYPALKAGRYVFICTVHPGMIGDLNVV